jgi:hypothetical protein
MRKFTGCENCHKADGKFTIERVVSISVVVKNGKAIVKRLYENGRPRMWCNGKSQWCDEVEIGQVISKIPKITLKALNVPAH